MLKLLIILLLIIINMIIIILFKQKYTFNKQKYTFNDPLSPYYFQHNEALITFDSYQYVRLYKQQLVKNITNLLDDLNIKFVISHGNLIEYEREEYIFMDDDVDIRFDINDLDKWIKYCKNKNNINNIKYNLKFDDRFYDINKQKYHGTQAKLINFNNCFNIKTFVDLDINLDLTLNKVSKKSSWIDYDIDFNNLRTINYLGVKTYCPSEKDTKMILKKEYGNYMIPNKNIYITK